MSEKKSLRGTLSAKGKDYTTEHLYIPDEHLLLIYHAQFYRDLLLLCMKHALVIYDIKNRVIKKEHRVTTHCAVFIPNTPYVAYATTNAEGQHSILQVWNYEKNSIDSRLTFTFEIETLKASHHCLIFCSLRSLYVIHFPTLKPIFNGNAGNGFNIVYDISREGLTVVHSTETKGEVSIRNFTNGETNRYLNVVRTTSNQFSERIRKRSTKKLQSSFVQPQEEQIKNQIHIKAHHENISILRLSPNGYRFVSGSTKGTVLRLFSCLNGELMSQYHLCAVLSSIVDINFIPEGNAIVCLNDQNHVKLFHTKMSEEELICESVRRGREVYEQENPKPWFSFLGFINEELAYERPFSYFNLESLFSKDAEPAKEVKGKNQQISMSEIKEQPHEKESQLVPHEENEESSKQSVQREVYVQEMNIAEIINTTLPHASQKSSSFRNSNTNSETELKSSKNKSFRGSTNVQKKKSHSPSIKSLVRKQAEVFTMSRERTINFRGAIMFENHINVKVFKGKYYYELKYDPFNGGEMMTKQNKINLLDVCLARGL